MDHTPDPRGGPRGMPKDFETPLYTVQRCCLMYSDQIWLGNPFMGFQLNPHGMGKAWGGQSSALLFILIVFGAE